MFSDSTTRRYTPPTCTLEVTESPASSWIRQSAKDLQFRLRFEDPRQLRDQAVQVNGDRTQLEALEEVVESYIQRFLGQTTLANLAAPAAELTPKFEQAHVPTSPVSTPPELSKSQQIELRAKDYLSHDLFLGSLANKTSGPVVNLSASSLFDLASALEESKADVAALPSVKGQRSSWFYKAPLWARVAAGAVLFVGATLAALQLSHNSASDRTAPVISQRSNEEVPVPLPPPPNATLPPFQNLPPLPPPVTLPRAGVSPPTPRATSTPVQPAPKMQPPSIAPIPKQPKQSIAIQPRATTSPVPLPEVPDLETSIAENSQSPDQSGARSTSAQSSETAFDTAPQVAEVRSYFQQRWKVPSGLKQTLEYTLTLSPNGSVQQTTPLNQAARVYLDRTPIPLRGEPFVSPVNGKGSSKIRLVLRPDGKVQTFLQSTN